MGYDPKNSKEEPSLPADLMLEGAIIDVKDGILKDFVTKLAKWKQSPEQTCINVTMQVKHEEKTFDFTQIFTYELKEGMTVHSERSGLGNFKKKYGQLPETGVKIKAMTNNEGYLKVKLD